MDYVLFIHSFLIGMEADSTTWLLWLFIFVLAFFYSISFETGSPCVVQAGLKLEIFVPQLPSAEIIGISLISFLLLLFLILLNWIGWMITLFLYLYGGRNQDDHFKYQRFLRIFLI
jgi:hypothetical protein